LRNETWENGRRDTDHGEHCRKQSRPTSTVRNSKNDIHNNCPPTDLFCVFSVELSDAALTAHPSLHNPGQLCFALFLRQCISTLLDLGAKRGIPARRCKKIGPERGSRANQIAENAFDRNATINKGAWIF
jgi:hypothetical protein